jgi:hypothetical protein
MFRTDFFRSVCLLICLTHHPLHPFYPLDDLDRAAIEGLISDPSGSSIAFARVTAIEEQTERAREAPAGADGRYRFTHLAPGRYRLRVEAAGFRTTMTTAFPALAGETLRRDFQLALAPVETSIAILDGESTSVDPSRTVIGGTLGSIQIDQLPIEGRDPLELLYLLPGFAPPPWEVRLLAEGDALDRFRAPAEEAGSFSLGGGAPFSNNLTIEGLDNNDDRAARERFTPALDAVAELQVIANQFAAEYGRASGGRVNVRLRGGSSQFHGRAFYYLRDARLNANAFHRNADPARGFRLPFSHHNAGASLGGPLAPQRAFFFAAFEADRISDQAEIAALVPVSARADFPLPAPNGALLGAQGVDRQGRPTIVNGGADVGLYDLRLATPKAGHTAQARVDIDPGARHAGLVLLTHARSRDERGFPGGRRTPETMRRLGRDSLSVAFADDLTISPRLFNQARFQLSRLAPADAPEGRGVVALIEIEDPRDVPGDPAANPLTRRGTLLAGSSTTGGTDRREDRFQWQETLSYSRGPHSLRTGGDWQSIHSRFIDLADATGTFTFASPADFLAGRISRYVHRFNTSSALRNNYLGLFIQDDWRIKPRLTLAAGLRWDYESILGDANNFGPRLALAWDPTGRAKTAVRAGYGLFYNRALLRTLDDFLITSRAVRIDTAGGAGPALLAEMKFPRALEAGDPRLERDGVRETGFLRRLERGFRIPESEQFALGFERELSRGLKCEINYVFNRGLHLWRESNVNAPRLPAGYSDFTAYLLARDFSNARDQATQARPITEIGDADLVRFDLSQTSSRILNEGGRRVAVFGLNHQSTSSVSSPLRASLAAVRGLRPAPELGQIEQLESRGNSFYHGLTIEMRGRWQRGFLRASYTLSRLIDDGVVNTSSALVAGDFKRERALSLIDARHRFAVSLAHRFPSRLFRLDLGATFNLQSPRPFNLGIDGQDRNLDDVGTDRPNYAGDPGQLKWLRPGAVIDPSISSAFSLPPIGGTGDLPRNAGRGPWQPVFNLRIARAFEGERWGRLTLQAEAFNPLNQTVFSFGAEYVDFAPSGDFLVPRRTLKPRTLRLGVRFER